MELIALLPSDVMLNGFPALQVFFQLFMLHWHWRDCTWTPIFNRTSLVLIMNECIMEEHLLSKGHLSIGGISADGQVWNCLIASVMVLVCSNGMPDTPLIVHVGRLGVEKNLDFLKRLVLLPGLSDWDFLHSKLMKGPTVVTLMLWDLQPICLTLSICRVWTSA
jgi:hypothetical protein